MKTFTQEYNESTVAQLTRMQWKPENNQQHCCQVLLSKEVFLFVLLCFVSLVSCVVSFPWLLTAEEMKIKLALTKMFHSFIKSSLICIASYIGTCI